MPARGADDGAGEAAHLAGVRAPRAAAAEEPRVGDLFPALEMALEHVGVADGELSAGGDGDLSLQHIIMLLSALYSTVSQLGTCHQRSVQSLRNSRSLFIPG